MLVHDQYSNLHPYGVTSFPFKGESGELSFDEGEVIELIRYIDGEWIEGRKEGVNGLVPLSYIQVIIPLEEESRDEQICIHHIDQAIGIAHVLHDFNGESSDELTVRSGSQIKVISYVNDEWIRCFDPMSESSGLVPISFVQIFNDHETEDSVWPSSTNYFPPVPATLNTPATVSPDDVWNSGWDEVKSNTEVRNQPPRPPAPSKEAMEILEEKKKKMSGAIGRQLSPITSLNGKDKVFFVVDELLSSENAYFLDIMAFVSAVTDSKMKKMDSDILCSMMAPLIQLSMSLHESLSPQKDMSDSSQLCIGKIFLEYRKSFSQVYSFYFRQLENAYKIMERADNESIVEEMMRDMRNSLPDNSCFDAATLLMRPIQRCLKYPLLLTQLVKSLPLNHGDHPKLIEAVKQMSNLASKMNESRRRRELVNKYSNQPKKSIGDRLSTINLHSIQKKSSRFTTRIGKTMGVIDLPKDSAMDNLLSKLYKVERSCVHFIYYLTVHVKKVQSILVNEKGLRQLCPTINTQSLIKKTTLIGQNWIMNVNLNVRLVVERGMREIPKKLIQKREDKLLDYYNALKKNPTNVTDKKREYDALSVQLRQKLPSVINSMTTAIQEAWIALRDVHKTCEGALSDLIKEEGGINGDIVTPISRVSLEKIRTIATLGKDLKEKDASEKIDRLQTKSTEDPMNVYNEMSTNVVMSGNNVWRADEEWSAQKTGQSRDEIRPQSTPIRPTSSFSIGHHTQISNPTPASINLLDLDSPSVCSVPVLQASTLTRRNPSLPTISTVDPFDEFSSLRVSTVSRRASPPLFPVNQHSIHSVPLLSSSHVPPPTILHHNTSSIPCHPPFPSNTIPLSTSVLQPTRVSSPLRVNPYTSQTVPFSSTNPFRDFCDNRPS